jgi:hypothetical protein
VGTAFEGEGFTAYRVAGFGYDAQIVDKEGMDLGAQAQSIVDTHGERVLQQDETPEETRRRWHLDPDIHFELPGEEARAVEAEEKQGAE